MEERVSGGEDPTRIPTRNSHQNRCVTAQLEGVDLSTGSLYNTGVPGDRESVATTATIAADTTGAVWKRMVRVLVPVTSVPLASINSILSRNSLALLGLAFASMGALCLSRTRARLDPQGDCRPGQAFFIAKQQRPRSDAVMTGHRSTCRNLGS